VIAKRFAFAAGQLRRSDNVSTRIIETRLGLAPSWGSVALVHLVVIFGRCCCQASCATSCCGICLAAMSSLEAHSAELPGLLSGLPSCVAV
jgi:hypothetical protein